MEYEEIRENFFSLELTATQKKYIHYYSVVNFLTHFESLPDTTVKEKVKVLLNDYYQDIQPIGIDFDSYWSYEIAIKYISEIGKYYSVYLGFKQELKISSVLLWGIMADSLLLFSGFSKRIYYIPICTLLLFIRFCNLLRFKFAGKTYGMFY